MVGEDGISDEELTRKYMQGDADALCALFDRYESLLMNRIKQLLPPHVLRRVAVSDVLQESRLASLERYREFELRGKDAFRKWALGIVTNKARRAVQWHEGVAKRSTRREVTSARSTVTRRTSARSPSPSQVAVAGELREVARRAMELLPEDYRAVLRLSRDEHVSLREAGEVMGRSHAATRKLHARALVRFTQLVRELRGGTDG